MYAITQNIRYNMPSRADAHDFKLTAGKLNAKGVWVPFSNVMIGRQEFEPARDKRLLEETLPAPFAHYYGPPGESCRQVITYDQRHWEPLDAGATVLHYGVAKVMPTQHILWMWLENKHTKRTFVFHTYHYIPGAWPPSRNTDQKWRQMIWTAGHVTHTNMIKQWVSQGLAVVGTGDKNRKNFPVAELGQMRRRAMYFTPADSIDDIWAINGNKTRLVCQSTNIFKGQRSDHHPRGAVLYLRKA